MITKKTLWLAVIASLVIGGVAGFEIDSIYFHSGDSHFGKTRFINFMTQQLSLTANQQQELDSIITYVHPKFQAIRRSFNTNMKSESDSTQRMIRKILTAEQQIKFDALHKKMHSSTDKK